MSATTTHPPTNFPSWIIKATHLVHISFQYRAEKKIIVYQERVFLSFCISTPQGTMRDNEGQEREKLSTVPLWEAVLPQQSGSVHSPSQCPVRVVSFSTSLGEAPQVLNRGWHLTRLFSKILYFSCLDCSA